MKFVIAAVVLALALGAESSHLEAPLITSLAAPYSPLAPLAAYSAYPYPYYLRSPLRFDYARAHDFAFAPYYAPYYAPQFTGEGTYLAKTRGSEHVAPLPGHATSAASINLEPAPGTQ